MYVRIDSTHFCTKSLYVLETLWKRMFKWIRFIFFVFEKHFKQLLYLQEKPHIASDISEILTANYWATKHFQMVKKNICFFLHELTIYVRNLTFYRIKTNCVVELSNNFDVSLQLNWCNGFVQCHNLLHILLLIYHLKNKN